MPIGMPDAALFQEPRFSVLKELADNPQIQDLIADVLRSRELLIDKVVELAGQKGVQLKKVPAETMVDTVGAQQNISRANWNLDLTQWLGSRNLTWSNLAPG